MNWKQYMITKVKNSKKGMIDIIYTTLDKNSNITSRQDRLFVNVDSKRYPYRCFDLVTYKHLKSTVEVNLLFIFRSLEATKTYQLFLSMITM